MSARAPNSKFIILALSLFLFLGFFIRSWASDTVTVDDDMEGFEELLALDEEEEKEGSQAISSEAEAVSKAQRIVLELSNDNTRRIIDDHKFVLVLGYAPWCVRSAELMPQFSEAATTLKEMGSPLLLAKLDAERYPKAASLLEIKGFPTMLLFVNGSSKVYSGGFSAQEIVIWARKKTGEPVIRINSATEAEEFLKRNRMFVIGLFEEFEGPEYKEFVDAATTEDEIQFAETSSIEVAKILFPDVKFNKPFMGLVKGELERYATFESSFRKDKILEFLEYNKFPLVSVLTELNSVRVYSSPIKLQVFVFAGAVDFKNFLVTLQDIARKFKSKIMFIYIDVAEENLAKPFLTLFGIEETEKTIVAAFDNKISSKYLLESDPTSSNIEEFCSGLLHGTLLPYFKSESIPDNKGALVQKVVGKTFDELVLSNPNNVLLEVHTPWCINCETTSKQIERLAKHFKGLDNLTIARFDASANEHSKLQIDDYPTLLFYPHNEKSNPIKLPPKSSIKELAMFINKNVRAAEDEGTQTQSQERKDEL